MEDTQPTPEKEPKGKIVTFYSYKGGVGRSMALANVAVLLAKMGKKVLIVDFDLEAPGLDKFFKNYTTIEPSDFGGVMGYLDDRCCVPNNETEEERDANVRVLESEISDIGTFSLNLLASGDAHDGYQQLIDEFSWKEFFSELEGAAQIEWLRNNWRSRYDFILIDSRTGITDIGGVCTVQLPDYLVLVFAANDQNLDGCKRVVEGIHKQRAAFAYDRERLQIIPLLSRFEGRAEKELSNLWLEKSAIVMQPMLDDWLPKHTSALEYFDKTKLPHIPKYAFGEQLACLEERETDPDSLSYYYSAIARLIAGHLQKPDRLLALKRRIDESEIQPIFERAAIFEQNRSTIIQMESLLASFTGAAAAQAQPMREHIKKLAVQDPDLRKDLEAVVLNTESETNRAIALHHLNNVHGWTDHDTAALIAELHRRNASRFIHSKPSAEQIHPDLEKLIQQSRNSGEVEVRRDAVSMMGKNWSGTSEAKAAILRVLIGVPEAGVPPDEDGGVRSAAIYALGRGWSGDDEVRFTVRWAVELFTEKLGAKHERTRELRRFLSHLSPGDEQEAR